MARAKISDEVVKEWRELRKARMTLHEIAEKYGVNYQTVWRRLAEEVGRDAR